LHHCLTIYVEPPPEPGEAPSPGLEPGEPASPPGRFQVPGSAATLTNFSGPAMAGPAYYEVVHRSKPEGLVLGEARRALADASNHPLSGRTLPTGHRSLHQAFVKASFPNEVDSPTGTAAPNHLHPISAPAPETRLAPDLPPLPSAGTTASTYDQDPAIRRASANRLPRNREAPEVSQGQRSLLGLMRNAWSN
jgi:hypothetical protein